MKMNDLFLTREARALKRWAKKAVRTRHIGKELLGDNDLELLIQIITDVEGIPKALKRSFKSCTFERFLRIREEKLDVIHDSYTMRKIMEDGINLLYAVEHGEDLTKIQRTVAYFERMGLVPRKEFKERLDLLLNEEEIIDLPEYDSEIGTNSIVHDLDEELLDANEEFSRGITEIMEEIAYH